MENELSWLDRIIIPKTQAYKNFIKEMERTPTERWMMDGERKFTEKEEKFLQIYDHKNGNKANMNPSRFVVLENDKRHHFPNFAETVKFIEKIDFSNSKTYVVQDRQNDLQLNINKLIDKHKLLADLYAKELTQKTDLSSGMTKTQIDEKQAYHFRNYEIEAKRLGIEITPFIEIGKTKLDIQNKASEIVNILNNSKKTLMLDASTPGIAGSITEIDSPESLVKNLERHFIPEGYNKSIFMRPYGEHSKPPIFHTTDEGLKNEFVSSLKEILNGRNLSAIRPDISHEFSKDQIQELSTKLQTHYDKNEIPGYNFNENVTKNILPAAIEIAKMDEGLKNTVLSYIQTFPPYYPQQADFRDDSYDRGESDYQKSLFEYNNVTEPEYSSKLNSLSRTLEASNINVSNLPEMESQFEAHYFSELVDELKRNFSKEISEINIQNLYNNKTPEIMEKEFDQLEYLKAQFRYLGFGGGEQLHKDLEKGVNSKKQQFEIKTTSDKTLPGNKVDFTLKFNKTEKGGVFLNSYDANLTNEKGESVSQNFRVSKENSYTAKEAINLLEGRSVKIEFDNPKSKEREPAFVKLNFGEEKNQWGNYNFQIFYKKYGVDAADIVEKSNLVFDKPEFKADTIKSLEKGNIVKVKFEMDDQVVEGKAVLNPQNRNLKLYDSDMNRINTNKPLEGLEQDNKHEKNNVKEQSIKR